MQIYVCVNNIFLFFGNAVLWGPMPHSLSHMEKLAKLMGTGERPPLCFPIIVGRFRIIGGSLIIFITVINDMLLKTKLQ